ncbi:MAG: right-handed parallel beta-helix repeat-containing protein [Planctomycetes bacterium]|nr:right-handed parallel beta-helix repeat-containing protein [Planctomycetota bacterium]
MPASPRADGRTMNTDGMDVEEWSALLDAYCNGTIDAEGAQKLAVAIRSAGEEGDWVMEHLALINLVQHQHDHASADAVAAGFLERLRAERTGSKLVRAVRERSGAQPSSPVPRRGVSPWLVAGAGFAAAAVVALTLAWPQYQRSRERGPDLARVAAVDGAVVIVGAQGERPGMAGGGLVAGETIITRGGSASLSLTDGSTIAIAANSELGAVASTAGGRSLALMRGSVRVVAARQAPGQSLSIATSHGTAQVVGTRLSLAIVGDTTRLDVEEGAVRFASARAFGAVTVSAGQYAIAVADDGPGARIQHGDAARLRDATALGATPDDAEDDAYAIQEAIDAAAPGDIVYLPAGTYRLRHTVRMRTGVSLRGESRTRTILRHDGQDAATMLSASSVRDLTISELTIDGASSAAGPAVFAYDSQRLSLHHLSIRDFADLETAIGIQFIGDQGVRAFAHGVTDSVISDNSIERMGVRSEWGAGIRVSWGSSQNRIERNRIDGTGRGGIFANDGCEDLVIVGNSVTRSGLTAERFGIEIWKGCHRAVIEDNAVDHRISFSGSDRVAVRGNTIGAATGASGQPPIAGIEIIGEDAVVTGNRIEGGQRVGLLVDGKVPCRHLSIARNQVQRMHESALSIRAVDPGIAERICVSGNTLAGTLGDAPSAGAGVILDGTGGRVLDLAFAQNDVTGNAGPALVARGSVTRFATRDDRVADNAEDGWPAAASAPVPPAVINAPTSARVGQTVRFVGAVPADAHALWDLDDGIPAIGSEADHRFAEPGTYRVTLLVWRADGGLSRSEHALVIAP